MASNLFSGLGLYLSARLQFGTKDLDLGFRVGLVYFSEKKTGTVLTQRHWGGGGIPGPLSPNHCLCPPKRELCPPKRELCPEQINRLDATIVTKYFVTMMLLECSSRPETSRILDVTTEFVSKNNFFVDFAINTVCFDSFTPEFIKIHLCLGT